MSQGRVVITGLGAITPVGNTTEEYWNGLLEGKSGAGDITRFDPVEHKVKFACEVKNYDPLDHFDRKEARRLETFVQFGLLAAKEALAQSGLKVEDVGAEDFGCIVGSGIGGLYAMEEQVGVLLEKGPSKVAATLIPRMIANMATGQISISLGLKGPNNCPVTACATGTHAIGDAFKVIARGQAKAMIAGGAESTISPLAIAGFANMKALSTRNDSPHNASRPFSADRDGFVMGEGAGVVVLEDYEYAKARGANILGEIVGYGMTADAFHITAPAPEGEGAQRSMKMAIKDARIEPSDISYINAHGTSTPLNDKLETLAVKAVFGDHAQKMPLSSVKSCTGHLLGAAGGIEAVASIKTLLTDTLPPTINFTEKDEDCDLDYVTEGPRKMETSYVMSNSFGFGGHNATLIFKKAS